jgi:hypothetical protein
MVHKGKEPCKDEKHCAQAFVSNELCVARREAMCERIDGLKKTIWASAATVGFVITVIEIGLRFAGR